jgi:hypothetical protein
LGLRCDPYAGAFAVKAKNATTETLADDLRVVFDDGFEPVVSVSRPGQEGGHLLATKRVPQWADLSWTRSSGQQHRVRVAVADRACRQFRENPQTLEFVLTEQQQIQVNFFVREGEYGEREVCIP